MSFVSRFGELHEEAVAATGMDDFGAPDYIEPLKLLLASYDQHCRFTPQGEAMAAGGVVGMLVSRLFAQRGFKNFPDAETASIDAPLLITGMPRTGSTTLQKLLACDPDLQWLPPWLGAAPQPRPPRDTWDAYPMLHAAAQGLKQLYEIVPEVRGMHPMHVDQADECRCGFGASFWRPDLAFTGPIRGSYAEWVLQSPPRGAYAYYRKVLALIGRGDARRWLLKDPTTHPFAARTMLETFPDARIVWTHRDPDSAMSSVSDMMYWARRWYVDGLTLEENGREQLAFWAPAIEALCEVLSTLPPSQVVHVHIKELQVDPIGTAERIYRHFDIPVTNAARAAWQRYIASDPRGGHGTHVHEAGRCGFSTSEVEARLSRYSAFYRARYPGTLTSE